MTSNGKQFTVTREMLTAVAGISARFPKFAFVFFCYITNHLMTGPLGNSEFCFPRISMFPSTSSRETLRFSGNKIHCSPRDQSLSVKCCMKNLTVSNLSQRHPACRNTSQHLSTGWPNARNMLRPTMLRYVRCFEMLRSFGRGLRQSN